ncbi:hypothetical protein EK21DRAFT_100685 [Setomelanomma holmii]|uniref:SSD domain-containing protein n=1 Tax=Setomelanomma holmii TaxID=210430 RepID=A0A9P4HAD6_9PLEO|nr:hypothetical protein EK21DRAFT_100685 [Setomelanomma holmii]
MAKTKPQDKKSKKKVKSAKNGTSKSKASPEELLIQAATLLQTAQPEEALVAAKRALNLLQPSSTPSAAALPALNLLGEINVELGDPDSAKEAFEAAIAIDPEGANDGAEKFLWMAQLNEEGGAESVRWFEQGIEVLKREIGELEGKLVKKTEVEELLGEKKRKVANSLCGIAEVYMTDLSWEEDAETRCEATVTEALLFAPNNPEPLQTHDDAKAALARSMELWKDLDPNDPGVPDYSTRISLSRLLMEAELEDEAIEVLERLVGENDGSVEAWYLGGWCLHLLSGKQKAKGEADIATSLLRASRDWLENCLKLYTMLEYEDERLKDHADEILKELDDTLGPTTEPPRLEPSHPIRRAFQAYGTATARHWLLSIVLTIIISVLLCYPAVFQIDSPAAASLRNLPEHVWTSTTAIEGERPADVVVRQVWVHGDYMKAIELPVLREAMHVQDALIGSGFDAPEDKAHAHHQVMVRDRHGCVAAAAEQHWGYHSPLMYWDCSASNLEKDADLLRTINSRTAMQSALNITLRPSSLFAGKTFIKSKLRAADALVITLFDQTNSNLLGESWAARAQLLAEQDSPSWTVFPADGQVTTSRLYEFRFRSMTLFDDLLLAASYLVTAVYVIWRMMQLRAVKSWLGLLVTVCAKMTICIIASFSLCTYLGIDLTRIPRPWFPGVVFCFGLGNIFRLINVVLETPPEMPPHQRIGNALGEVGHLSLAVAFQNLALIYLCSRLVTPWVADFCIFAAVTLVFDFVYHITFFVAVLSVDVQRMELSDSLERVDMSQRAKKNRSERQSWLGALRGGTLPLSTRFAGSVAIISFILAINWHFFDAHNEALSFQTFRQRLMSRTRKRSANVTWSLPPINQARTPADWLRIQDHNTARELFGFIKPGAHSFIARIYDPLLVVSKGAYGRDRPQSPKSLTEGFRRFAQGHAFPAALMVVFLIAGVTLLMNYLLWTGLPEILDESEDEDALFSVKTLPASQSLDIASLVSGAKGHLASISLDRSTSIWLNGRRGYMQTTLQTTTMKPRIWPIVATAMDDSGSSLAFCSEAGQIGIWNMAQSHFSQIPVVDVREQVPVLFAFVGIAHGDIEKPHLVILLPDGFLTEVDVRTGTQVTKRISSSAIVCATVYTCVKATSSLVFVTRHGEVHISSLQGNGSPSSEVVAGLDPGPPPGSNPAKIKCIQGVPSLGLIFALRDEEAEIFDFNSRALIHSFQIGHVKPHTLRVLHPARRACQCGAPSVHSLSIAYTEQDADHMIMQTLTLNDSASSQLCLGKPSDRGKYNCRGLDHAVEAVHYVEPAGAWESTSALAVVGIRRSNSSPTPSSTISGADDGHYTAEPAALASALKQQARKQSIPNALLRFTGRVSTHIPTSDADSWEAWTLSTTGQFRSRPLLPDNLEDPAAAFEDDLFVVVPGPITRLGTRSVAVGFGNTTKIITLGKELFQGLPSIENGTQDPGFGLHNGRGRRGTPRKVQ